MDKTRRKQYHPADHGGASTLINAAHYPEPDALPDIVKEVTNNKFYQGVRRCD